jgi:superfamily II DNA helicase RecQ
MINMRVFTIKFNREKEQFEDEVLRTFCSENIVLNNQNTFFTDGCEKYMSVFVTYEMLNSKQEFKRSYNKKAAEYDLSENEKILFEKLKQIRNEKAELKGLPAYCFGTNNELSKIVRNKCTTLEALKDIKGFGKKKIEDVGKEFTEVIKNDLKEGQNSA